MDDDEPGQTQRGQPRRDPARRYGPTAARRSPGRAGGPPDIDVDPTVPEREPARLRRRDLAELSTPSVEVRGSSRSTKGTTKARPRRPDGAVPPDDDRPRRPAPPRPATATVTATPVTATPVTATPATATPATATPATATARRARCASGSATDVPGPRRRGPRVRPPRAATTSRPSAAGGRSAARCASR